MSQFLPGLAISGYRSFGPHIQRIGPFDKINLFVGPNNSGKSNILRMINSHIGTFSVPGSGTNAIGFDWSLDRFIGPGCPLTIGLGCPLERAFFDRIRQQLTPHLQSLLDRVIQSDLLGWSTGCAWSDTEIADFSGANVTYREFPLNIDSQDILSNSDWAALARHVNPNVSLL